MNIVYITNISTYKLMKISKLVITSYSTTALEALFFSTRSVRFSDIGTFPLFDREKFIPDFNNFADFSEWFDSINWEKKFKISNKELKLLNRHFFKIDEKASTRLWEFIKKINYKN